MLKILSTVFVSLVSLLSFTASAQSQEDRVRVAQAMEKSIQTELLNKWYPQSVDKEHGGFLSSFSYDFKPSGVQDKMIVTQARHVWSNSKASILYPGTAHYKSGAAHGYRFLRDVMWDKNFGGFYTLVTKDGRIKGDSTKTAYGNAFGIYALAAYYEASKDANALELAKKAFLWLEEHSHDPVYKGYFQHLDRNGNPIKRTTETPSTSDLGYKDQNSSIHLLEAFTELYHVWPDALVRERLQEMLFLIRDTITNDTGYLTLFLQPDWTPVSYRDSSESVILKHRNLNHVSYGHDVETAYLMMEAAEALGFKNDQKTLMAGKKMVDHALRTGWDSKVGGFYDQGYYFKDKEGITIIKDTKNWWAQAEGLNTLLIMAIHFPQDEMRYFEKFKILWKYVDTYIIDHQYGDWYASGLDKEPETKTALKGHIWKATYHQFRALANCVKNLKAPVK